MRTTTDTREALPISVAARYLCVPAQWLRHEVESGRLPALVAGRNILIHVPTVAALLAERAKGESRDNDGD
jgi:hypothetical protein